MYGSRISLKLFALCGNPSLIYYKLFLVVLHQLVVYFVELQN